MGDILHVEVFDRDLREKLFTPEASLALSLWEFVRRDAAAPREAAFLRANLLSLRPHLMVLRPIAGGEDFVYASYGERIAASAGFDMTGKRVSDFKGQLGRFFLATYQDVMRSQRPLGTMHRLGRYNERPLWERLILPVATDDGAGALYVVNKVRRPSEDFALISSRARGDGVMALDFVRDDDGRIVDAVISGANAPALAMIGRRLDEIAERSIRECFPGVVDHGLWERYLAVARDRVPQTFRIRYCADGIDGVFDVHLQPFRDSVAFAFRIVPAAAEDAGERSAHPSLAAPVAA